MAAMASISLTPPRAAVLVFSNCPVSKCDSSNERSMGNMAARVAILMAKKAEMRIKPLSATKSRATREPLIASIATDNAAMEQDSVYCVSEAFIFIFLEVYTIRGYESRWICNVHLHQFVCSIYQYFLPELL